MHVRPSKMSCKGKAKMSEPVGSDFANHPSHVNLFRSEVVHISIGTNRSRTCLSACVQAHSQAPANHTVSQARCNLHLIVFLQRVQLLKMNARSHSCRPLSIFSCSTSAVRTSPSSARSADLSTRRLVALHRARRWCG